MAGRDSGVGDDITRSRYACSTKVTYAEEREVTDGREVTDEREKESIDHEETAARVYQSIPTWRRLFVLIE